MVLLVVCWANANWHGGLRSLAEVNCASAMRLQSVVRPLESSRWMICDRASVPVLMLGDGEITI